MIHWNNVDVVIQRRNDAIGSVDRGMMRAFSHSTKSDTEKNYASGECSERFCNPSEVIPGKLKGQTTHLDSDGKYFLFYEKYNFILFIVGFPRIGTMISMGMVSSIMPLRNIFFSHLFLCFM